MNNWGNIPIISINGEVEGALIIDVVPIEENGNEFNEVSQNLMGLVGIKFTIFMCIFKKIRIYNLNYKSKIYNEDGKETSFNIDEKFNHNINHLNEENINFFMKNKICFKVYAYETVEIKE